MNPFNASETSGGGASSRDPAVLASLAGGMMSTLPLVGAVALVGVGCWQAAVWYFELPPALLPTPSRVVQAAWEHRLTLLRGTAVTALAASAGLVAAILTGSMIAVLFSQSRRVRIAFFPYIVFLQTVPIVAIAPLLIIWSGYRFRTVVIVTVIVCLFPIVNSVTTGLMAMSRDLADLFSLYGAGRFKRLFWLQMPTAVRYLMLGAKTSSGLAVIGAIVAEFFVGNGSSGYEGLGTLMTRWQARLMTDALIASLFASTLVGLVLFGGVQLIAATVLRRWMRSPTT